MERGIWAVLLTVALGSATAGLSAAEPSYRMVDLGQIGFAESAAAVGINNRTQILIESSLPAVHAWLLHRSVITDLGSPAPSFPYFSPRGINSRGDIVGSANAQHDGSSSVSRGFIWKDGVLTDIGFLAGRSTFAMDINNRGQVVGRICAH